MKHIGKTLSLWGTRNKNRKGNSNRKSWQTLFLAIQLAMVGSVLLLTSAQAAQPQLERPAFSMSGMAWFGASGFILLMLGGLFGLRQKWLQQKGVSILAEESESSDKPQRRPGRPTFRTDAAQTGLANLPIPMLMCDAETLTVLAVNDAAISKYQYSQEEFLQLTLNDLQVEESLIGDDDSRICIYRKKDGEFVEAEVHTQETVFAGKNALLMVTYDIGKWQQEHHLLRSLMDQLPVFLYAKDRDSRFVFANHAVAASKGLQNPEDLIGKSDFDFYPHDLASEYRAIEEEIMSSGQGISDLEVLERDHQGNESWFLNARVPWVDRQGKVIGILGVNRDITERKRVERALQESQSLFDSVFNGLPQNICCKDQDGRFIFANKVFCQTIGQPPEKIIGNTDFDLFPAELAEKFVADDRRVLKGEVIDLVEQNQTPDGQKTFVQVVKAPRYDSNGDIVGLQVIFWDVTERKQSEEAFEKSLAELQMIVTAVSEGDLTKRAIENEDHLGRIAQSVNKMLDNFSGMIQQVKGLGLTVSSSAVQILGASEEMAVGSERQSGEITNTSAAIEEMAASMSQVSRNADNTTAAAYQALEMAKRSGLAVHNAVEAMERIDSAVKLTSDKMHILAQRSSEISEILDLISGIASQTNMLSVNAAIQAAHAGEAGLGFSVVADEIRKLAEKSVQSTKDINRLVNAIRTETGEALSSMEIALKEVRNGSELAEVVSKSIDDISGVVTQSASLIEEISVAAEEQSRVSQSISEAMQTVSGISVQTSAGIHQTSQIMQNLVSIAENLSETILKFKISE